MFYVRRENLGDISYSGFYVNFDVAEAKKQGTNFKEKDFRDVNNVQPLKAPLSVTLNITAECNKNCLFCCFPCKSKGQTMSTTTIDSITNYIENHFIYEVDILGGEPFIDCATNSLFYLLEKIEKVESIGQIYITTNGMYLNNMISLYKKYHKTNLSVSISLQTSEMGVPNSAVFKCIKYHENHNIPYHVSSVISKHQIQDLNTLCQYMNKLKNCKSWLWHYPSIFKYNASYKQYLFSLSEFYSLIQIYQKKVMLYINHDMPYTFFFKDSAMPSNKLEEIFCKCSGMGKKMEIFPNGDVYPCVALYGTEQYCMGNINEKTFRFKPLLDEKTTCKNKLCKHNKTCKVCVAYYKDWGADDRCPGQKQ